VVSNIMILLLLAGIAVAEVSPLEVTRAEVSIRYDHFIMPTKSSVAKYIRL
jgi:hypothetical protein